LKERVMSEAAVNGVERVLRLAVERARAEGRIRPNPYPYEHELHHAEVPETAAEEAMTRVIYDELTNNAMGRGLGLDGSVRDEENRWLVEVSGQLDLVGLARRVIQTCDRWQERRQGKRSLSSFPSFAR
jgi:hypothetical protein